MSWLERSDEDAIVPVAIGTAAWAVVLVVLATQSSRLAEAGTQWWLLAAGVGVVSGTLGLVFLRWRRRRMDVGSG